ncbi:MAG: peptide chain release factor N(5)-glutamine methyltransferase [Epsilonproteobacteria bacterium]|nr:peptide chain release factor N(5)-glutamine methyltransferase [Campylobacterota bacterium]OIO14807.1 MAG: protein-(glutamine-N5) methyltransferase, release factor-specific [Helicobacteraceae bacterium CG1_02_36_14]PIP10897.1 MAG: protein-(glutamine-N5) methyltransferase, release factor-specific [Sulfurimonas sp. CG23_combo_of_CG06-09_8_20_14_all_36_33]PIS26756.1 MAG: peptide chain release factor N(5)-glutamine methyltransferase [Sulfurimonas sp. CG08_land_8_20_14_0_20_36_33]PIU35074.1 MAG: p
MRSILVEDVLKEITSTLNPLIERASREAQLLLMAHLQCDELWLMSHKKSEVKDVDALFKWVARRAENEPLEYITKRVSFYSEEFYIAEGALIPRPETELFIDKVVETISNPHAKMRFVEVGVGSGIISIMLALKFPHAKFIAVDISQTALEVAKINIKKFSLEERIELRLGSLLEPVEEEFDYLISNPPYIPNSAELESNLSYEPQNALFGGEVGDEIIKELLNDVLKRNIKFFTCEMGYDQKDKITNFLKDKKFKNLNFYEDLSGFDRGFTLEI